MKRPFTLIRWMGATAILGTIVASPWLYATTRDWAIHWVCVSLASGIILWCSGSVKQIIEFARDRRIGLIAVILSFILIGALNRSTTTPDPLEPYLANHYSTLSQHWSMSFVQWNGTHQLLFISLSCATVFAIAELGRSRPFRLAALISFVASGTGIAALGIYQKENGISSIFEEEANRYPGYFFSTFFHHTNAGAYLNLCWTVALGLFAGSLSVQRGNWLRILTGTLAALLALFSVITIVAAQAYQVSKAAQAIALATPIVFLALVVTSHFLTQQARNLKRISSTTIIAAAGVALSFSAALYLAARNPQVIERWGEYLAASTSSNAGEYKPIPREDWPNHMRPDRHIATTEPFFLGPRGLAMKTGLSMLPDSGLFGFGAGSWKDSYHNYTEDPFLSTFYLHMQFTHSDPLQFATEWGVIGFLLIFFILVAGPLSALRNVKHQPQLSSRLIEIGVVSAIATLLFHSTFDFPLQIPCIFLTVCALCGLCWSPPKAIMRSTV